jgi:hypothetical protein
MKDKEALFKKFVNNPKYTSMILQTINEYDFTNRYFLMLSFDDEVVVLYKKGNDIKVKK